MIAGNWKMYNTLQDATKLVNDLIIELQNQDLGANRAIIIPPYLYLKELSEPLSRNANIYLGAQNCHYEKEGAFTGEISARMLASVGTQYVVLGHSERRQYFNEDNALLAKKVNAVLAENLIPIYCCGETLEQRENNQHFTIIQQQIEEGLFHLSAEEVKNIIVAYEPVWAIGTGKTASPEQAQEIHAHIRDLFSKKYGQTTADNLHILYGGSVKPNNAAELFGQQDIDGALVGGASLKASDFAAIIKSA
ncbi:MAG: triose-phosphate isomerase [Bacteroidia bacterium]